jgi:hypothetical protein
VLHFYSTKYTNIPGHLELVAAMAVVQENVLSIHGGILTARLAGINCAKDGRSNA